MPRTCMLSSILGELDRRIQEAEAHAASAHTRDAWGQYAGWKYAARELQRAKLGIIKSMGTSAECQNRRE